MVRALEEQTVLITGATDGLGRGLAQALAARGARVLVHGRDDERGRQTLAEIKQRTGNKHVHWYRADLASLSQVRALADRVRAEHARLDAVVSNAGVGTHEPGGGRRLESEDGHELRFAVNYLAGFLLIRRLLDLLRRSVPARIVQVASAGQAPLDFDDVMLEHRYDGVQAYCQSKLAQIMFTLDLAQELRDTGVSTNCLHPGTYMPTKMVLTAGVRPRTALEAGVAATLRLVVAPELNGVSGRYFDGTESAAAHPQASDPHARERLLELSLRLCGEHVRALGTRADPDAPQA